MSNILTLVGNKVRNLRQLKGFTQEELAEKSGLQSTYIGGVERGERNISLETLEKILTGLNVKVTEFFQFDETDIEDEPAKEYLIDGYKTLLINRTEEEIKTIHKMVKDVLALLDSK
ncbi:helix-turn-helix domain-containing protein [Aquibacillus sediminis]|uniref:helix-turn-helix domain-containing protein n=1 Tax=Aquibacillus sediminis TaxID=2574734 RepID=UPI001108972C|nr:helix-turn-helix transcriptional regulator [Aquibacillus sediminis]